MSQTLTAQSFRDPYLYIINKYLHLFEYYEFYTFYMSILYEYTPFSLYGVSIMITVQKAYNLQYIHQSFIYLYNGRNEPLRTLQIIVYHLSSEMLFSPSPAFSHQYLRRQCLQSGHIAFNQKFYDKLITEIPSLALEFRIHSDRTLLTIRPSEQPNYKFPKGGALRILLYLCLVEQGIPLPARYEVALESGCQCLLASWLNLLPAPENSASQNPHPSPRCFKERGRKQ